MYDNVCHMYDICMTYVWQCMTMYDICMTMYDICMTYVWHMYDICMTYGKVMASMWQGSMNKREGTKRYISTRKSQEVHILYETISSWPPLVHWDISRYLNTRPIPTQGLFKRGHSAILQDPSRTWSRPSAFWLTTTTLPLDSTVSIDTTYRKGVSI